MTTDIMFASNDFPYATKLLKNKFEDKYRILTPNTDKDLSKQVKNVDVIIPAMSKINKKVIDNAEKLKLIVQWGVGLEGVNQEYAESKGIKVTNTPGENALSVAEHSLYLMFGLARKQNELHKTFSEGKIGTPVGMELNNKNLLIIGLGSSGKELAKIGNGIGMNVKAIRKHPKKGGPTFVKKIGHTSDMDNLLPSADFVALHLPLTNETRNLIDKDKLSKMKETAYLVNVSRGPIINKKDLKKALKNGEIAGAALDVYWEEPPTPEDSLYNLDNIITTPHIAGITDEAYERIANRLKEIITEMVWLL